jgi:hypothetical protein
MEKITDKLSALPSNANYFSLEFFPPKTAAVHQDAEPFDFKLTVLGLFKPPGSSRTHVTGSSTTIRDCDMGRWW